MRRSAAVLGLTIGGSFLLTLANDAFGHAHLAQPMRRANCQLDDDSTCKGAGPCGGAPNMALTPMVFNVGSSYDLVWNETVQHVSTYQINLSTNGGAAQANFFPVMPENAVLDAQGPQTYTYAWTVPNMAGCNPGPCVMQLIQDMDATVGTIGNPYYNCADIRVLPAGAATPTPTPDPTATPTPGGNPDGAVGVDGYGSCAVGGFGSRALAHGAVLMGLALGLSAFVRRRR